MALLDTIVEPLKPLKPHLLGHGMLSLAVIAAGIIGGAIPSIGVFLPALVVAGGGILLDAFLRLNNTARYEQQMVDLYRDDIASHLGIAARDVKPQHLRIAARDNEVIDQALKRHERKNWVGFVTSALAGIVTFALLDFGLAQKAVTSAFDYVFGHTIGNLLRFTTTGVIAGLSGLIVHDGLKAAYGKGTGLSKAAAHDRILDIELGLSRGVAVTKEQVYGVLVAGNLDLDRAIATQFRKPYDRMNPRQQAAVLERIGVAGEMQQLAQQINAGTIRPGKLSYMVSDAITHFRDRPDEVSAPAVENARGTFVERNGGPRQPASHTARLESEQALPAGKSL